MDKVDRFGIPYVFVGKYLMVEWRTGSGSFAIVNGGGQIIDEYEYGDDVRMDYARKIAINQTKYLEAVAYDTKMEE